MRLRFPAALAAAGLIALSLPTHGDAPAESKKESAEMAVLTPTDMKWQEAPPSLPKGAMIAVLEGDPTKEGEFVMRARMPDGYRVPPHTHPKTERVTVISGEMHIGMGEKFDEKTTKAMPAGTYGHWPAGMKHFAWMKGETVIQLHGTGPWSIEYVNPADDPRKK